MSDAGRKTDLLCFFVRFPLRIAFLSALVVACVAGLAVAADDEPTKADIPAGLSTDIRRLIERTFSDDKSVRAYAAKALGRFREPWVFEVLLDALRRCDPEDQDERGNIELLLLEQRDPESVPILLGVFQDSKETWSVRTSAAWLLARLGDPSDPLWSGKAADVATIDAFLDVLGDAGEPAKLRSKVCYGLGRLGERRAVKLLEAIARDRSAEEDLRATAVVSLRGIAGKEAIPLLRELAVAPDERHRLRWCAALGLVKETDGAIDDVEIVGALSPDPNPEIPDGEALKKIMANGKTAAAREAAKIRRGKHASDVEVFRPLSTDKAVFLLILSLAYYCGALTLWAAWYHDVLRLGHLTRRSLIVLVLLLVIGLPLVALQWELWG